MKTKIEFDGLEISAVGVKISPTFIKVIATLRAAQPTGPNGTNKVLCIKLLREAGSSYIGLKEAKDVVDFIWDMTDPAPERSYDASLATMDAVREWIRS